MLKALFAVRLEALKSWLTGSSRLKKAQSKGKLIGFTLLMLYAFVALGFLFWRIFDGIALPFHMAGLDWLYFAMAALMCFALMFVGSIFMAKAQLYEARDNDLLLSMPIKPRDILLSRMFMLWVVALVFGLMTAVPALIAWEQSVSFDGTGLGAYIIIFVLLLPLFALAVSALFGWLLSVVSARLGGSSLVSVLLSLIFLGAYMYFAFRMNTLISALAQNPDAAAGALGAVAVLRWIGSACAAGNPGALAKTALIMLGSFALAYFILEKTFIKTATARRGGAKKKYVAREERVATPRSALLRREWMRFLSSSAYILNCGLGAFMALAGAVVLLIKKDALLSLPVYPMLAPMLQVSLAAGLCFCAATILVTAPSVSLEGRSLWIAQSLPVDTREILRAKLRLHNMIAIPPLLVCSAVSVLVLRPDALMSLSLFLLPALFGLFAGVLGLAENLRHPSFDWVNETQAVKSGASVMLTMFISWGVMIPPVLVYVFFGESINPAAICLVFAALIALLCFLLYRWLMTRGAEIYKTL